VGRYAVWPDHHGVNRSDDWTVNGTTYSIVELLGLAVAASVALVEGFLLAGSVVVMGAMAIIGTMGMGRRLRANRGKHDCGAYPCGQKPQTVEHRLFAIAPTVWMQEPEVVSEDC